MQVFDFDNTLYRGESAVDFALFLMRRRPKIMLWLPKIFWNLLKYKLCLIQKEHMEAQINRFMQSCLPDEAEVRRQVRCFWRSHIHKLNAALVSRIKPEDIIITAGPYFLLNPIRKQLGTSRLIASEVDLARKTVQYLNFSERKAARFRAMYGDTVPEAFFTDSYYDRALMDIARRVYLVKKRTIRRIR